MFALKGPKMKHGANGYDTNFPLEHAQKDVRFAQALGDDNGLSLSVNSAGHGTLSLCSPFFNCLDTHSFQTDSKHSPQRLNRASMVSTQRMSNCQPQCYDFHLVATAASCTCHRGFPCRAEWYKAAKGLKLDRADFCAVIESIRASAGRQ